MAYPYDSITLQYVREQVESVRDLDFRLHPGESDERGRDEYSRDYARVLYSASFRRLQGKMQLLGVDQHHFIRNRLTHSMEVAQIARGIAADMGIGNTFPVEACALAHDLGNPPIGHHGESVLNELAGGIGGFEGNAQTLRILRKLEKKHHAYRGLNLTFRTQLGVIKYFRRHDEGRNDKFIYDEDYDAILQTLEDRGIRMARVQTIDMQIMDLADEIAYAAHDLEDLPQPESIYDRRSTVRIPHSRQVPGGERRAGANRRELQGLRLQRPSFRVVRGIFFFCSARN